MSKIDIIHIYYLTTFVLVGCSKLEVEHNYPMNDNRVALLERQGVYNSIKLEHKVHKNDNNKCDRVDFFSNIVNKLSAKYPASIIDYNGFIFNSDWMLIDGVARKIVVIVDNICEVKVNIFQKNRDVVMVVVDDILEQKIIKIINDK